MRAYVFPGQGSQKVGMGADLYAASAAAREVFEEVDDALGQKLFAIMRDGPDDVLTLTENAQPAIMANTIAVLRVLEKECGLTLADAAHGGADFVAGHSLGEYTALCAAGSFSLADTARLLRLRGQAMQAAVPVGIGAMCVLDVFAKYLALRHGAPLTTFSRYASGTVFALMVWEWQGRPWVAPGGLQANLVRGTLIAAMALAFFWSITRLPLALVLTLTFVGPLAVPFMAALFLKEPVQPRYIAAGVLGFIGVLVTVGGNPSFPGLPEHGPL